MKGFLRAKSDGMAFALSLWEVVLEGSFVTGTMLSSLAMGPLTEERLSLKDAVRLIAWAWVVGTMGVSLLETAGAVGAETDDVETGANLNKGTVDFDAESGDFAASTDEVATGLEGI